MAELLGFKFSKKTRDEIINLPSTKPLGALHVITANPEMLMAGRKDEEFAKILRNTEHVIADGSGFTWLCNLTRQTPPPRIPGVDLMVEWLQFANENRKTVLLVGGSEGTAHKLRKILDKVYPRIRVEHIHDVTVDQDGVSDKDLSVMSTTTPDFIFAAFGHGKQEKWIAKNLDKFPNQTIAMGVGGAFDFISGQVKRAPCWMRKFGLEWLYRVIRQPWRIGRIITAVPHFTIAALWHHFKHYDRKN